MRISTAYFHDSAAASIVQRQAEVQATQAKLSSSRKVSTAADDPVGAARAVRARAGLGETERWQAAQSAAKTTLSITESTLGSASDILSSVRDAVVSAGNPSLSAADRQTLAEQVRQGLDQLVGLANTTDGDGSYLFAGFANRNAPFVANGTAVSYAGDGGQRAADLGPGVRIPVTQSGDDAFMRLPDGNGVFSTAGNAANAGTGVVGVGRVTNASLVTGHQYEVRFNAGGTTYDVWDLTAGAAVQSAQPFSPGGTVSFDGLAFEITGSPASGDKFAVNPSANASVFDRLKRAIDMLQNPATGSAANAWRAGEIGGILKDLDVASDHLLAARAVAGNALARIDTLSSLADDRSVAQNTEISSIEDLDYAQAASELAKRNLALQAAMSAYAQTGKKSLFDFL
jgi:flagellar hook-associated protein 3 FlgL